MGFICSSSTLLHCSVLFREWLFFKLTQKPWYKADPPKIRKSRHLEPVGRQSVVHLESQVGKLSSLGLLTLTNATLVYSENHGIV